MSFDWRAYVELAGELLAHPQSAIPQEAYLRSAISRAYYGVFGIARNFIVSRGIIIPRIDTHKFVRETYFNSSNKEERKIGKDLRDLWHERKEADYENSATFDIKRAMTAYQLATRILARLKTLGAI
jgi:uncharacterized protein (UPF0332 family)